MQHGLSFFSPPPAPSPPRVAAPATEPLHAVPSTLLIPLAARAHGARLFPWLACADAEAERLLDCLGADVRSLMDDAPTVLNILWRTRLLKAAGWAFFRAHPDSLGASLGCGLSHHFQWLDNGHNAWIDADLPEVMDLRARLLPVQDLRRSNAFIDLTEPGWWQRLGLPSGPAHKPVFVLCEGVLMYLSPAQVQAVLAEFAEQAPPGSQMMLDTMSQVGRGMARLHPTVGPTGAQFLWCPASADELTRPHPRLRLLQTRSVSECYGWLGAVTEACWMPVTGTPMYAMVTLSV